MQLSTQIDWYDWKSISTPLLYEDKSLNQMTTADKAKQRVAESLLSKIDACDRLLDKTKRLDSYEKVFKTRLLLLTRLEDLVLCT